MLIRSVFHWRCRSSEYVNSIILISPKLLLRTKTPLNNCSNLKVSLHDISQMMFVGFFHLEIILYVEMGIICIIKYTENSKFNQNFPIVKEKNIYIQFPFLKIFHIGHLSFIPTLEKGGFPEFEFFMVSATPDLVVWFPSFLLFPSCSTGPLHNLNGTLS